MFFGAVVSKSRSLFAMLFQVLFTAGAGPAGIDEAAHRRDVADFEMFNFFADGNHFPDDLMPRHAWINGIVPFIPSLVNIGMANPAVQDLDLNIFRVLVPVAGPGINLKIVWHSAQRRILLNKA